MSKKRKRKGFSIAEVVIALAIIVTVSVTAISISLLSVSARISALNVHRAHAFADNAWECFKVSESEEEFIENLEFAEGVTLSDHQNGGSGAKIYTYHSEKYGFTSYISVNFTSARYKFEIIVNGQKAENIVSFSYEKGDGI